MPVRWVIAFDPDSRAHGVAIYTNGKLTSLRNWTLPQVYAYLALVDPSEALIAIEDVNKIKAVFRQRQTNNGNTNMAKARNLGMMQQSATELERVFVHFGFEFERIKINNMWKDPTLGKKLLARATGWTGRSNPDTRSAAYMGWVVLNSGTKARLSTS